GAAGRVDQYVVGFQDAADQAQVVGSLERVCDLADDIPEQVGVDSVLGQEEIERRRVEEWGRGESDVVVPTHVVHGQDGRMIDSRAETGFTPQALDERGFRLQLAVDDLQRPLRAEAACRAIYSRVRAVPEARDQLIAADAGAPQLLDVYHGVISTLLLV